MTLEELIQQVTENFGASFQKDGFELEYQFERSYPSHIRIGFLSTKLNMKLLFVHEWRTGLHIGTLDKTFTDESGWVYFERLVDFIQKRPMRWIDKKKEENYVEFLKADLARIGKEFSEYHDQIVPMFLDAGTIAQWEPAFRQYVKDEIQKKYNLPPRT